MSRYIRDLDLQLPAEEVEAEIRRFREDTELYPTVWNGENCFCADYKPNGLPSNWENYKRLYFFRSAYDGGMLHIEAWMREGKKKESSLTGLGAMAMKQLYLNEIISLEKRLIERLPEGSELRRKNEEWAQPGRKADKRQKNGVQIIRAMSLLAIFWALLECLKHLGIL